MRMLGKYLVVICVVLSTSAALAQGRRGGGDGGYGGGDDRFGGGGRGGRAGRGGNQSFSPEDMLRRFDTNGNGFLEEDEVNNGPGRFMVERVFSQMGIQPKYPIAISELARSLESFRQNRGPGGRGGGFPPGGRGAGFPPGGRGQWASRNAPPGPASANDPLRPPPGQGGFGETTPSQGMPLGFGDTSSAGKSATIPGASDPSTEQKIRSLAEAIVRKYDKNGDGRLDKDEWPAQGKWGTFTDANRSGGSSIGQPELISYLTDLSRRSQLSLDLPDSAATSGTSDPARPKSGRFLTAKERLPKDFPPSLSWFLELADEDGQVTMATYAANRSPEEAVARFAQYDLNHDGIITAAECLKVEKQQPGPR